MFQGELVGGWEVSQGSPKGTPVISGHGLQPAPGAVEEMSGWATVCPLDRSGQKEHQVAIR
jgi:hypothetical protein